MEGKYDLGVGHTHRAACECASSECASCECAPAQPPTTRSAKVVLAPSAAVAVCDLCAMWIFYGQMRQACGATGGKMFIAFVGFAQSSRIRN